MRLLPFWLALAALLSACADPAQQAKVTAAITIACNVSGVVVPIALPIVGTMGPAGAVAAGVDGLLVHPAVVAACAKMNGVPLSASVQH